MDESNIKFGQVIDNYDPLGAGRIKVRVSGADLHNSNSQLLWAVPLLPKMLHIIPKLNETVMIINRDLGNDGSQRFYIGPVISQPQFMYEDTPMENALQLFDGSMIGGDENPLNRDNALGTLPKDEDIAILGRKDSDIILKDNDIRIRCGVKKTNPKDKREFVFNDVHPAFIKLKHYNDKEIPLGNYQSVATIAADKINLVGTDSRDPFKVDSRKELMSEEEVARFVKEGHQLPFGDNLIDFLKIFIKAFQSHVHPWVGAGMTPCKDFTYKALADYNLESILSTTVRIN